jgi:hypothetical protein
MRFDALAQRLCYYKYRLRKPLLTWLGRIVLLLKGYVSSLTFPKGYISFRF